MTARYPISASRLATFARCGFQYLLQHVLRLEAALEPEERKRLDALERGTRVPRDRGAVPARAARRGDAARARRRGRAARLLRAGRRGAGRAGRGAARRASPCCGRRERARFHEGMLGVAGPRGAGSAARSTPAALRGELRPRARARGGRAALRASRSRSTSATAARCASRARSTASTRGRTARSSLRDYKTGRAPPRRRRALPRRPAAPDPVLPAGRRAHLPRRASVADAFLDYVDGGRQVAFDPAALKGDEFRALLRGAGGRHRPGQLRAGAHRLRLVRLHGGVRARGRCWSGGGGYKIGRPAAAARACACGTWDERLPPVDDEAPRARAPRPRHEPRPRGRRRHRQDDAARRPHRGAAARGRRAPRPDRGRHLHRERGHHHEAAPARAAGEGARSTRGAPRGAAARGRRAGDHRARADLDHPRALRGHPRRAAAGVRRRARLPHRRRGGVRAALRRGLGRVADRAPASRATTRCWRRSTTASRSKAEGPYGERASLRGLARTLVEQRDLQPAGGRRAPSTPRPGARELAEQAAPRARRWPRRSADGDTLAPRLAALAAFAEEVAAPGRPAARARGWPRCPPSRANFGHKQRWPSPEPLAEARDIAAWTPQASARWKARAVRGAARARGGARCGRSCCATRRPSASAACSTSWTCWCKARDALRDRADRPRATSARASRCLIIDEFQDTDPLQVEIARLLAGDAPGRPGGGGRRQAVDLPLPPRGGRALPRAWPRRRARGHGHAVLQPHPELPLAAGDPALREPRVRRR